MRKIIAIFICWVFLLLMNRQLIAGGALKKLQAIGDNLALQEKVLNQEEESYRRAEEFINSPDIKEDLYPDFVLERCGQPVARADDGRRWVYKPPSSTFFKGEKIYFIFDENNKLKSWKKLHQE